MFKLLTVSLGLLLLSGCAAYGVIDNAPLSESVSAESYSIKNKARGQVSEDLELILALNHLVGPSTRIGNEVRVAAHAGGFLTTLGESDDDVINPDAMEVIVLTSFVNKEVAERISL